jgi:hypothetical protein
MPLDPLGEDAIFEAEVRRIADTLWGHGGSSGAVKLDGRERDGLYETAEMIHLVEATTSRRREKAASDCEKLAKGVKKLRDRNPTKGAKGWFITRDSPTVEQLEATRKFAPDVVVRSLAQFRSQLVDASEYLKVRSEHPFGSAQDPETSSTVKLPDFIPLGLVQIQRDDGRLWNIQQVLEMVGAGRQVVVLGDFGAGKSMTLRHIFFRLLKGFDRATAFRFPIHLNLREHHGQSDPAEALERHARTVGFSPAHHLVRAWRSGHVDLILDGFDELASPGWTGSTKRMGAVRHSAMSLVRNFVQQTPPTASVVVAGRHHFFDSTVELHQALGLDSEAVLLTLNEFTDEQVSTYLSRRGWRSTVPSWLPARPLLLGYLAARGLLPDIEAMAPDLPPPHAWDALVERICTREAAIDINLDGGTVRLILERLATKARGTADGLGPISFEDMTDAFHEVCGYRPDDKGIVLLQRLPGLGLRDIADNSRQFVDEYLVDTARAGDVTSFLVNPYAFEDRKPDAWVTPLGELGADIVAMRVESGAVPSGAAAAAFRLLQEHPTWGTLAGDIARVIILSGVDLAGSETIFTREADLPSLRFDSDCDLSAIHFQDCLVHLLELAPDVDSAHLPTFTRCAIGVLDGRVSEADLPPGKFIECTVEEFAATTGTTAGIMRTDLPLGVRVALTILKKLYLQSGSGRRESALYRGLDPSSRRVVADVLRLVEKHQLGVRSRAGSETIWMPVRPATARARSLVAAPTTADDPLLRDAADI